MVSAVGEIGDALGAGGAVTGATKLGVAVGDKAQLVKSGMRSDSQKYFGMKCR
jgi:hypothetical protein